MRIATYNLNNLFERPVLFQLEGFSGEAKQVLNDITKLNSLLEKENYTGKTLDSLQELLEKYFLNSNEYFDISQVRAKLFTVHKGKLKIKVGGRNEWDGFVSLKKELIKTDAILNTARVVKEVNADIMCTVEVEDRISLDRFNESFLKNQYKQNMLIDGNDDRGIDVGVLSKYEIGNIRTHIHDSFLGKNNKYYPIFSRDCAHYEINITNNKTIHLLCNHFKSKGYGNPADNDAKRLKQSERVAEIIKENFNLKKDYVVVAGDFNDTTESKPLAPLRKMRDLFSVIDKVNGDKGTYQHGKETIDNIFVSKALWDRFEQAEIERRGIFHKKKEHFDTVTGLENQASDHAAVWAEFDL